LTEEEFQRHKEIINQMSQMEMARLMRFAPAGYLYFTKPLSGYFEKRFHKLGGMTPAISKAIGW